MSCARRCGNLRRGRGRQLPRRGLNRTLLHMVLPGGLLAAHSLQRRIRVRLRVHRGRTQLALAMLARRTQARAGLATPLTPCVARRQGPAPSQLSRRLRGGSSRRLSRPPQAPAAESSSLRLCCTGLAQAWRERSHQPCCTRALLLFLTFRLAVPQLRSMSLLLAKRLSTASGVNMSLLQLKTQMRCCLMRGGARRTLSYTARCRRTQCLRHSAQSRYGQLRSTSQ
mmetsp:Transcript_6270/g.25174  ORF Transcript_6270/g.25174 Transcript_6270/m.25174 type:complete len:226 (+) Transcript_6270:3024-3701(+)